MIIVNIKNGLGNQMFQYAFGRVLELKYNVPVLFDLMREGEVTPLTTDLDVFSIETIHEPTVDEVKPFKPFSISAFRLKKKYFHYFYFKLRRIFNPQKLVIEPYPSLMNSYFEGLDIHKKYYFLGFWQNPTYFEGYEDAVRKIFIPKDTSIYQTETAQEIVNSTYDTVSLHIRRGDYLTCGFMEPASIDFYVDAIAMIKMKLKNPFFYIFTDDPQWALTEFKFDIPYKLVQGNEGKNSYKDILLMSLCQHHVIANSSFSWWGAWLNPNPNKIVIAPKKWYASARSDKHTSAITPKEWMRL